MNAGSGAPRAGPAAAAVAPPSARTVNDAMRGAPSAAAPWRATLRTARWLSVAAFLVYVITGGGRIVGSDEITMLEVSRGLLRGDIAVSEGATLRGPDGRFYSKNAAGEAVLALPLVALASAVARASGLDPARAELALRFGVSFFNAIVTAALLGVFYAGARGLGAGAPGALAAVLLLGFATPLWVYAKSFMAEPLQALGLLMAALGAALAGARDRRGAAWLAAAGVMLAVSVKLSMLPLALACLAPLAFGRWTKLGAPALGLIVALLGHALYDQARFGTPFETGYGAQATPAAYSTPILVGLYGLLLSSGKGVLWFAPPLWLAPAGFRRMWRASRRVAAGFAARLGLEEAPGRAACSAIAAIVAGLLLYARFQHWAGDGSFGPRYLVPLLPLAFLAVAFALDRAGRARLAIVGALAVLGVAVQIGGVSVYFGAQMREAGDYPYTRALEDPRFMSDSHWNPRFTPIAGHWRMLARNLGEHLAGRAPAIRAGAPEVAAPGAALARAERLGLGAEEQRRLLHALDYWWLYLGYAGLPRAPVAAAWLLLMALAVFAAWRARSAWRAERAGA